MDITGIDSRKKRYDEQKLSTTLTQWMPVKTMKWWHVQDDPAFYLIELYAVVDSLTERCTKLERHLELAEGVIWAMEAERRGHFFIPWWKRFWNRLHLKDVQYGSSSSE